MRDLFSWETVALIALFYPGSVSLPAYWDGHRRRAAWGDCLGGPSQIWGPGECYDSAALRTLTATLTAARQPMRADGNADGNALAKKGEVRRRERRGEREDRGKRDGRETRNYRYICSFVFLLSFTVLHREICVNKEVNDVVYKEREETVSSSVNKRLNCK